MLKGKFKAFWNKVALTALCMLCTLLTFAQLGPPSDCGDTSGGPDEPCPLDTWVIVLAVIALAFAAYHLQKKQKSALKIQA